jgi:hypothetical protein
MAPATRSSELDAALVRTFGVAVETSAWLPPDDAEPETVLRAAIAIGEAIGDHPASTPARDERTWVALPLRPGASPSAAERRAAVERALAWARSTGASWDGIEFVIDEDGSSSARACRVISSGESILTIPRRLMIIDNELAASTTGKLALGLRDPRQRDALAAWLPLEAREPASRWRAHLEALPAQLAELPMFHGEQDLATLAGTTAHAIAGDDARAVRQRYDQLSAELRARLSLADFAWGCAIVMSRAFHAPGSLEHRIALLPVVDFMNHRLGDTTWSYDPADGLFVISTERAFATGDEVHFSYGDRSNTHLFVHYGFTEPTNAAGEAGLLFERASDPVTAIAAHLLWNAPLDAPARMRVGCQLDHRFLRALALARLQAAGPIDRARALDSGLTPYGDIPWLGAALERTAFAVMAAAARRALAALEIRTRPADDSAWSTSCAIVRGGERVVLEQLLELATAAPDHLHAPEATKLRAAAEAIPGDAIGAQRLLRQYLRALADALPE